MQTRVVPFELFAAVGEALSAARRGQVDTVDALADRLQGLGVCAGYLRRLRALAACANAHPSAGAVSAG